MNYLAHIYLSGDDREAQLGGLLGDFVKGPLPLAWLQEPSAVVHKEPSALFNEEPSAGLDKKPSAGLDKQLSPSLRRAQTSARLAFQADATSAPLLLDATGQPWSRTLLAGIYLHRRIDAFIDRQPAFQDCVACLGAEHRRIAGIALDVFFDHLLVRHWQDYHTQPLPDFCDVFYAHCAASEQRLPPRAASFMARAQAQRLFEGYADLDLVEAVLGRIAERFTRPTSLARVMPQLRRERHFLTAQFERLMPQLQAFAAAQRQQLRL